jgi:phospholipid transport system substrate-binding protein
VFTTSKAARFFTVAGVLFLLFVSPRLVCASVACQSDPLPVIQEGTQKALEILHQSECGRAAPLRQRKDEILAVVDHYFSFDEMAKSALGHPWKEQTPQKRREFTQLFKQLLFNTYVERLQNYTGSNEKVSYDSQEVNGSYALVKTHILYQGDKKVSIDYRLHQSDGKWKVYDVVVEGISLVVNYRSQFSSILANESFDSLLQRLREKVQQAG